MPEKPRRRLGTIREDAEIREDADRARSIDPTSRRPPPPREATDAQICRRRPTLLPPPLAAASAGRGGLARSASRGGGQSPWFRQRGREHIVRGPTTLSPTLARAMPESIPPRTR